ncbi:energy transducer TonB [Rhodanobacter sp. L36]|uniref:energy transducer TonB n=1 Tax=Rhodanobacter sp. L36 TaxID=1747221 RepID=UPI00131ADFD2|nr:energy transducer TonB [Rhodanobacter sp. L36]
MKRWLIVSLCLAWSVAALAAENESADKQLQSSMLVTGSIVLAPNGTTQSYTLDHRDKLPSFVADLIDKGAHVWRFEPILLDGKPVAAKADMSLRIVARRIDKDHISVRIAGAQFGQEAGPGAAGEAISMKRRTPIVYPQMAQRDHVSGVVYLLLRVGRDGLVSDAVTQQVNLRAIGGAGEMNRWRRTLADAALRSARNWTFNTPTHGKHAGDKYWLARVPINFNLNVMGAPKHSDYGEWDTYVPGPIEPVMWPDPDGMISSNIDAQPEDGLYQPDRALRLVTPLNGA